MTKWARIRRRKERQRAEAEERQRPKIQNGEDVIQPEKTSENIQQKTETKKPEHTQIQTQKPIISQIPRYVYLVAFFALLSGVFFPLITDDPRAQNFDNVLKGCGILFLGLVGAILVYKGATSNKKRATFVSCGLAIIAVSLLLIFTMARAPVYN